MKNTSTHLVPLFIAIALISCLFSTDLMAGDTYTATLSGVECDGCKKTIARSLAKIDGVKTIKIVKTGDKSHRMTVTTDGSKSISKSQASAAISHAEHYKILSWSKSS